MGLFAEWSSTRHASVTSSGKKCHTAARDRLLAARSPCTGFSDLGEQCPFPLFPHPGCPVQGAALVGVPTRFSDLGEQCPFPLFHHPGCPVQGAALVGVPTRFSDLGEQCPFPLFHHPGCPVQGAALV